MRSWASVICGLVLVLGCRNAVQGEPMPEDGTNDGAGEGEGEGPAPDGGGCVAEPTDGLVVKVVNTETLFPVCDARVTADDGAGPRELRPSGTAPECDHRGATDAPGVYLVRAEKEGFSAAELAGVNVRPGTDCALVQTVHFELQIVPAP